MTIRPRPGLAVGPPAVPARLIQLTLKADGTVRETVLPVAGLAVRSKGSRLESQYVVHTTGGAIPQDNLPDSPDVYRFFVCDADPPETVARWRARAEVLLREQAAEAAKAEAQPGQATGLATIAPAGREAPAAEGRS